MDTMPAGPGSVSHYRLLSKIGAGGMGEVWLAEDTQLPRKVAVKLLPRDAARDPQAVARLLREAQAAATVDHPAVVTVYEAGVSSGAPYLVMQRVEGETLSERLTRGPLPVAEAVTLAERVADALAEVHALGIVHRDLKPSNIILSPRGPKVVDFGVASLKGAADLTSPGSLIGTPLTMSPEQVTGRPADNRSDLWALGVVLYAALTGREPFAGETPLQVGYSVVVSQPPPPSSFRPEVTPALDQVVIKLLRKDPAQRYARAEDLLADLHACQAELNAAAPAQAKSPVPRVAVLYFEVLGSSPDDAFLAAGLTDDLIVDLSRLGGLRVASREDVRVYRDRAVPPRTLGRELEVDYILLGSVRRAGNRIRVAAQFVRASDGQTLWTDRLDRTLEDLFSLQTEVSHRIVEALQVALQPGEREMLERIPSKSTEVYFLSQGARAARQRNQRGESTGRADAPARHRARPGVRVGPRRLGRVLCGTRAEMVGRSGSRRARPGLRTTRARARAGPPRCAPCAGDRASGAGGPRGPGGPGPGHQAGSGPRGRADLGGLRLHDAGQAGAGSANPGARPGAASTPLPRCGLPDRSIRDARTLRRAAALSAPMHRRMRRRTSTKPGRRARAGLPRDRAHAERAGGRRHCPGRAGASHCTGGRPHPLQRRLRLRTGRLGRPRA